MTELIARNNAIYFESAKAYPFDHRGVKWASAESQRIRFEVLCEIAENFFKSSILDVGCGLGHLIDYLQSNQFSGVYKGIDTVDQMVLQAKKRYPLFNFETNDLDAMKDVAYDYVIASGIFTFVNWSSMQNTIEKLFLCSKKGVAFNSLSALSIEKESEIFYPDPIKVFEFCKKITSNVVLRQDYMPHDFTIYLYH
ncbi:class I SAM-dependent methyltransferase [Candidatus Berkiella cookevillensis]|uniref:Class I SAM-dependent methyltransferase n=1 Tax=Candidatus Berkiella cookevillensis TaxID=437022 RepID=A0A0Q9YDN9_9GAMM|nr:class I SAM-dependent methyltransferase [Candidatus Berkiella cookevillensis]MCS5707802.1 class I SAM-dependent methyltransferase [Candidatus Berkiella cookevillensis]